MTVALIALRNRIQALTPIERLESLQNYWGPRNDLSAWWISFLIVGLCTGVALFFYWRASQRQPHGRFYTLARRHRLTAWEQHVLAVVARAAGARPRETIFKLPEAFENGVAALEQSEALRRMDEARRAAFSEAAAGIRAKLWPPSAEAGSPEEASEQAGEASPAAESAAEPETAETGAPPDPEAASGGAGPHAAASLAVLGRGGEDAERGSAEGVWVQYLPARIERMDTNRVRVRTETPVEPGEVGVLSFTRGSASLFQCTVRVEEGDRMEEDGWQITLRMDQCAALGEPGAS